MTGMLVCEARISGTVDCSVLTAFAFQFETLYCCQKPALLI